MLSSSSFESKVEHYCSQILRTDAESWDVRNKAILSLTTLISPYEHHDAVAVQEVITMDIFRMLKEPITSLISDLRSQQVRDVCLFLKKLSEVTKDHMRYLLREVFVSVFDGIKVKNRVMSGYVNTCILNMIKNTTFKGCIPTLIYELRTSKSKFVREQILHYMNEILVHWDINEKEAIVIGEVIQFGIEDASVTAREISRCAYLHMFQLYPKICDKIKESINNTSLQARLTKEEENFLSKHKRILSENQQPVTTIGNGNPNNNTKKNKKTSPSVTLAATSTVPDITAQSHPRLSSLTAMTYEDLQSIFDDKQLMQQAACFSPPQSKQPSPRQAMDHSESFNYSPVLDATTIAKPSSSRLTIQLRVPRVSMHDDAATSIQAAIRGKLSRKSIMMNNGKAFNNNSMASKLAKFGIISNSPTQEEMMQQQVPLSPQPLTPPKSPSNAKFSQVLSSPITPALTNTSTMTTAGAAQLLQTPNTATKRYDRAYFSASMKKKKSPKTNTSHGKHQQQQQQQQHLTSSGFENSPTPAIRHDSLEISPSPLQNNEMKDTQLQQQVTQPSTVMLGTKVKLKEKNTTLVGIVRYIGKTNFAHGQWIGLELNRAEGKNDGSIQQQRYFQCPFNHGIFVRMDQLILLDNDEKENHDTKNFHNINTNLNTCHFGGGNDANSKDVEGLFQGKKKMEQVAGLLRWKLGKMMDSLNQQMDTLERMDELVTQAQVGISTNHNHLNKSSNLEGCFSHALFQSFCEQEQLINEQFMEKLQQLR